MDISMGRKHAAAVSTFKIGVAAGIVVGLLCGFFVGTFSRLVLAPCVKYSLRRDGNLVDIGPESAYLYQDKTGNNNGDIYTNFRDNEMGGDRPLPFSNSETLPEWKLTQGSGPEPESGLVLVGVMTAKKYLNSRIVAAYETYARHFPGQVLYFSSEGSEEIAPPGVPIIGLPGVDDSYPPQKKSFMMLKYMHDFYRDKYEFFMRADDDVYIRGENLASFLHSVNSSKPLFMGQAGLGKIDEIGKMNLNLGDNFCMGGPGMVLTRATLVQMAPHVSYCLKNLYTTHEDVEIGRCIKKFANISCTWAYEMQNIFHNNYKDPNNSYSGPLKSREINQASTLHPVKKPKYQYRLHQHFLSMTSMSLRQQIITLQRQVHEMNSILQDRDDFYSPNRLGLIPSLLKFIPKARDEVLDWEFMDRSQYSLTNSNPRRGREKHLVKGLEYVVDQVMEMINKNARQRGRTIDFKEILYGYRRVNPLHSTDYVLDLLLVYKKHKGKRKMTVPVRRHAYLQQSFTEIEFSEGEHLPVLNFTDKNATAQRSQQGFLNRLQSNLGRIYGSASSLYSNLAGSASPQIHFIMPLSGRFQTFLHFINNFEDVCLRRNLRVALLVMIFHSEKDDSVVETVEYMRNLQIKYPSHLLTTHILSGPFSRGLGLQKGAAMLPPSALLFFIDVDMHMHVSTPNRILHNTIRGVQVYYPIVFSQYDPQTLCQEGDCPQRPSSPFYYNDNAGYWRQFGFGIAGMYNSDFIAVGGFDTDIKGWGKEDVDLYEKYIAMNMSICRAVDPGLVHIFHPIFCDPNLDPAQYQMCLGSKGASYASTSQLASVVLKTPEILHRNEPLDSSVEEEGENEDEHPQPAVKQK